MHPTALHCPRCRSPLQVGVAVGVTLHGCSGCGGVWLHTACAQRLAAHLPADAIELARVASHHARGAADVAQAAPCPVCARQMTRSAVAMARVDIDFCPSHGTWYDRHELEAIARAMHASRPPGASAAGPAVAVAVGAAAVGTAAAVGVAAANSGGAAETVGDVVGAVGGDVLIDGTLGIIGGILGSIFD